MNKFQVSTVLEGYLLCFKCDPSVIAFRFAATVMSLEAWLPYISYFKRTKFPRVIYALKFRPVVDESSEQCLRSKSVIKLQVLH